jgi:hypothetical protein
MLTDDGFDLRLSPCPDGQEAVVPAGCVAGGIGPDHVYDRTTLVCGNRIIVSLELVFDRSSEQ